MQTIINLLLLLFIILQSIIMIAATIYMFAHHRKEMVKLLKEIGKAATDAANRH